MNFSDTSFAETQDGKLGALTPQQIAAAIRAGRVPADRVFDANLPDDLASASSDFWTPLAVALKVGSWLRESGAKTVLDIGAGAGKFCVAASLVTDCVYFGIEHRPRLVAVAQELARRFDVDARVAFIEGAFGDAIIVRADAVYLFNPFGENLSRHRWLDDTVGLGPTRYKRDVILVERFLSSLPAGTLLVTYNGFGGCVPACFAEIRSDDSFTSALRMWRKGKSLANH
jgi:SAM-dependent methyltransferase